MVVVHFSFSCSSSHIEKMCKKILKSHNAMTDIMKIPSVIVDPPYTCILDPDNQRHNERSYTNLNLQQTMTWLLRQKEGTVELCEAEMCRPIQYLNREYQHEQSSCMSVLLSSFLLPLILSHKPQRIGIASQ
jgi:hypothetical protein